MAGIDRQDHLTGPRPGPAAAADDRRLNILGVGVSPLTLDSAVDRIDRWVEARFRTYVCVCSVHGLMEARRSPGLRRVFNRAGMVTSDGMPLVWVLRRGGFPDATRVYGPDLMLAALEHSQRSGRRHFFYGGQEGVAAALADAMRRRFPGLQIAGTCSPPVGSVEALASAEAAVLINEARPDVVWVGISTPKQERWMAAMRDRLEAPVLIGVGAAFDFHTGGVKQAPAWMRRRGLEWLYRLLREPRRLWHRYLVNNPWFIFELALQASRIKRFEIER